MSVFETFCPPPDHDADRDLLLRIALVAEDYYPQLGGVPEHVHNLALQLLRWGHGVTVVTSRMRGAAPDPDFVRRVGRSRLVYANGGVSRITTGVRLRDQLEKIFREGRHDVVHIHGGLAPTFGLVTPEAARRLGIPVVATFHSWFRTGPTYRVLRRPFQRLLDRHAAAIAVSRPVVEVMSRYFQADWEVVPNGVDLGVFSADGRRPIGFTEEPSLLFLGRIEPRNRLGTVLKAMPRILARYPGARLTVVGDGPWLGYYRRRAWQLGSSVRFVGQAFDQRPHYYRSADLYLCPTAIASFGVTLLEAMACGTPMIVADNAGHRALLDEHEDAVLLPPEDSAIWGETVLEVLEDRERRQTMSQAGIARAGAFAWPVVARQELAIYQRVTGRVGGRTRVGARGRAAIDNT